MLEQFFRLRENGTNLRTEVLAGITTFMTMAYILAVNPDILSATGMDKHALFTTTALSAVAGTLVMALWARLPFALAPGMGLNAFFAFSVVLGMGYSWQFALTAVFLEGILFLALTLTNIREKIVDAIPLSLKHAVSAGIGLFIAFIGMQKSGIIVNNDAVLVGLGDMHSPSVWIGLGGVLFTGVLLALKVKGALLIGIFAATVVGIPLGVTQLPEGALVSLPPSISPIFMQFEWNQVFTVDMAVVLFTFFFVDMFDTIGTLIGVGAKANMLDEQGKLPRARQALAADAVGTIAGAALGTSTVTTFVESAAGVAEGGRTGLSSLTVAGLFLLSLFFAPVFMMIPGAATAPALILVGLFMLSPFKNVDLDEFTESIPAFFAILMMPLTYSVANGIIFGMLAFVLLKVASGKHRQVSVVMYILALLFAVKLFL